MNTIVSRAWLQNCKWCVKEQKNNCRKSWAIKFYSRSSPALSRAPPSRSRFSVLSAVLCYPRFAPGDGRSPRGSSGQWTHSASMPWCPARRCTRYCRPPLSHASQAHCSQQGPAGKRRLPARAFFILKKPRPGLGAMAGACEPTYPHAALFVGRE